MLCRPLRALREVWLVGSRWLCCLVAYVREVCLVGYVRQRRMQASSFLVCVASFLVRVCVASFLVCVASFLVCVASFLVCAASFLVCVASLASRLLPRLPPRLLRLASLSPYMPAYVPTSAAMPLCRYASMSLCLYVSVCLYVSMSLCYAYIPLRLYPPSSEP